jgi:hypothetical protein
MTDGIGYCRGLATVDEHRMRHKIALDRTREVR